MDGKYKKFDPELYRLHNDRAIDAVLTHINSMGLYATVNDDIYGPDVLVYKGFKPKYFIEVDLVWGWKLGSNPWPFKDLHVPERKAKFINLRAHKSLEFWSLSVDLKKALVSTDVVVNGSPKKEISNSQITTGELFYCVNLDDTTVVELISNGDIKNI
jgi:hypothetical protein